MIQKVSMAVLLMTIPHPDILVSQRNGGNNTEKVFLLNGAEYIAQLIRDGIENGSREAVVTGSWLIDRAIRIPSDFTLILDGCHLKMADGSFDNMFVNANHDTILGRTVDGTDRNISILGRNGAVLDGGTYNGLSEKNHSRDGMPPIWKNNLLLFTNVDGFRIRNLSCHNQQWWALNFLFCRNGELTDLDFQACDIGIDADGKPYHGLKRAKYKEVLVKNADGIDLRKGYHDILIENITGFTEDDSIALTGLYGSVEKAFAVEGLPTDIRNVTIRNIRTAAFCTNVRLLNQSGVKLHDILIDGVYDMAHECDRLDSGLYAVRLGDVHLYGTRHSTEDETYNITVRNVQGGGEYALVLAGAVRDLVIENISAFGSAQRLWDRRNET